VHSVLKFLKKPVLIFAKYNLCLTLTNNFLTLLEPSDQMFDGGTLVDDNVRGFIHSFRKMGTLETVMVQETWLPCERRQKVRMGRVKGAVSKVRVRGVNRWQACCWESGKNFSPSKCRIYRVRE
jgi:hypothetical protein